MVNAIRVASDFIASLPRTELTPEVTEGDDGFVHAYDVNAAVDRTVVKVLLRDFDTRRLAVLRDWWRRARMRPWPHTPARRWR